MRIILKIMGTGNIVPFNYQPKIVGALHKWLGKNELHGSMSMYSFSWLMNGHILEQGIDFSHGATMFISFYDESLIKIIIKSILKDPYLCYGMAVNDICIEENPDILCRDRFMIASPIFIRRFIDGNDKHFTFNDKESNMFLVETLKNKMKSAGLPDDETLNISFDLSFENKKVKTIYYNGIGNKTNWCPVMIQGKDETKLFAYNVGLGNSTGIGFGSIY